MHKKISRTDLNLNKKYDYFIHFFGVVILWERIVNLLLTQTYDPETILILYIPEID